MDTLSGDRYPAGTGFFLGSVLGAVAGAAAWSVTTNVPIGLLLFVAAGTPAGVLIEQSLPTRPATPRERTVVIGLLTLGMLAAFVVLFAVLFD